jgi:hypothetical protein
MAGLFGRLKIWQPGEDLTASDLNAEFNHFLSNIDAEHSEGYSENLSEMQTMEDPGGLGSENLTQPISVAQELQRLRFVIDRIIGLQQWYQQPSVNLEDIASFIDQIADFSPTRIQSGKTTALSAQANFLVADGSNGVLIDGTPTNLIYYVDGPQYTLTTDVTLSGLDPAPGVNNTALLTSSFGGGQFSKGVSEFEIGTVGSNISGRAGLLSAFKINNGVDDEFFIGTVTASNKITNIPRGFMFDSSGAQIPAITLTTGHTITLMKLSYIFLRSDFTMDVTYNPPIFSPTAPLIPTSGDYWYDTINQTWKKFVTGSYQVAQAAFVGICMQDAAGDVVAARSADFSGFYEDESTFEFDSVDSTSISSVAVPLGQQASVYGYQFKTINNRATIVMPDDLYGSETEQASTIYYVYVSKDYEFFLSEQKPIYRPDISGHYHPCEALKAIGQVYNNSSSDFEPLSLAQGLGETKVNYDDKLFSWEYNGTYGVLSAPQEYIDLVRVLPYPIKIKKVHIYNRESGTSGTTEFDIQAAVQGGSFASIFSTLGSIGQAALTSITRSGSTATATLNDHGFQNGDTVVILGATETEYNGSFVISNVTANTFDYTVSGSPSTPATGSPAIMPRDDIWTDSGTDIPAITGVVKPVLNQTVFQAGQALRFDLTDIMVGAVDCKIEIYYEAL